MTDRELAQEVIRGIHSAFVTIFHRYSGMVSAKAFAMMRTEEGAAEVAQQTFVLAYERLNAWHGTELAPWLSAIVEQTAIKCLKEERNRRTISLEDLPASVSDAFIYEPTDAEMYDARFKRLDDAIDSLSKLDQLLLRLKYSEDMSFEDIARTTGLTKNNVHVRLFRIGHRLRARY